MHSLHRRPRSARRPRLTPARAGRRQVPAAGANLGEGRAGGAQEVPGVRRPAALRQGAARPAHDGPCPRPAACTPAGVCGVLEAVRARACLLLDIRTAGMPSRGGRPPRPCPPRPDNSLSASGAFQTEVRDTNSGLHTARRTAGRHVLGAPGGGRPPDWYGCRAGLLYLTPPPARPGGLRGGAAHVPGAPGGGQPVQNKD